MDQFYDSLLIFLKFDLPDMTQHCSFPMPDLSRRIALSLFLQLFLTMCLSANNQSMKRSKYDHFKCESKKRDIPRQLFTHGPNLQQKVQAINHCF